MGPKARHSYLFIGQTRVLFKWQKSVDGITLNCNWNNPVYVESTLEILCSIQSCPSTLTRQIWFVVTGSWEMLHVVWVGYLAGLWACTYSVNTHNTCNGCELLTSSYIDHWVVWPLFHHWRYGNGIISTAVCHDSSPYHLQCVVERESNHLSLFDSRNAL